MTFNSNCPDCGVQEGGMHAPTCRRLRGQISGKTAMQVMNEKIEGEIFKRCGPTEEMFERLVGINPHDKIRIRENPAVPPGEMILVDNTDGFVFNQTQPINLVFTDDNGTEVGKFEWNKTLRKWEFTGEMNEAAKLFAKFMYAHFQSLIDGDRDGLADSPVAAETSVMTEDDPEKVWPTSLPHRL